MRDESSHVWLHEAKRPGEISLEDFDRVAFAREVLEILQPAKVSVALRPGWGSIGVERGRDWARPEGFSWAMVSIPRFATRREIVFTLVELLGVPGHPYRYDLLARLADAPEVSADGAT